MHTFEHRTDDRPVLAPGTVGPPSTVLYVDGVRLDVRGMTLRVDERRVDLTAQEFTLLRLLMENAGRVLRRDELLDLAWGPSRGRTSNTMSVLVSRLRRKLLRPDGTSRLRTVRNVGYVFDTAPD